LRCIVSDCARHSARSAHVAGSCVLLTLLTALAVVAVVTVLAVAVLAW
jgi:hypothetical protein